MRSLIRTSSVGGSVDFLGGGVDSNEFKAAAAVKPPEERKLPPKPAVERRIFTFPSPPRREMDKVGYFIDACARCKNQIHENHDRYMYGSLEAFCSIGCRDNQIALDKKHNPPSPARAPNKNLSKRGVLKSKFNK